MKNIVLFDMDGTLTPPRKKIESRIIECLGSLQKTADIGIVSGSPYDYICQQMETAWQVSDGLDPSKIMLMPCNGTQLFEYSEESKNFVKRKSTNMIELLGKEKYRIIVSILTDLQNQVIESYTDMPVSGNFISFRGSMINWCMIGRDADSSMRKDFVELDKGMRNSLHAQFEQELRTADIFDVSSSLGGSTSIDIYPTGWDKTYCLNHIKYPGDVYFVGDKCQPGGNDFELFRSESTISYETDGPATTIHIVEEIKRRIENG